MHSGKHYLLFANCLLLKDSFSASEFEHEQGAFAFRLAGRRKPLEHLEMEGRLDGVWHKQSVFSLHVSKKAQYHLRKKMSFVKVVVQLIPQSVFSDGSRGNVK